MKNSEEYAAIFMEVTAEIEGKSRAERIDILYGLYGKPLMEARCVHPEDRWIHLGNGSSA